jgi:hypothetical protein
MEACLLWIEAPSSLFVWYSSCQGSYKTQRILRQILGMNQYISLYELLQDDVMNHLLALYEWRVNLEDKNPNSLSWDWISGQRKLFVFYHPSFTRLNQANEITFYNAIILVLLKIGQEVIGQPYHPLIHTRPRNYPNCPIPAHSSPRQGRKTQSNCHWDLPQRRLQSTTLTIHDIQYQRQIMARSHTSTSQLRQKNSFFGWLAQYTWRLRCYCWQNTIPSRAIWWFQGTLRRC